MSSKEIGPWIVESKSPFLGTTVYVKRVTSYSKKRSLMTVDKEKAHKYSTEKNARKPADLLGGTVIKGQ